MVQESCEWICAAGLSKVIFPIRAGRQPQPSCLRTAVSASPMRCCEERLLSGPSLGGVLVLHALSLPGVFGKPVVIC